MLAELLLGRPIFAGDNSVNQLVEIIKQLGTPTRDQLAQMNSNYKDTRFPEMRARPWNKVSHRQGHSHRSAQSQSQSQSQAHLLPVQKHDTLRRHTKKKLTPSPSVHP